MKITFLTPALVAILGLALAGVPVTAQAQTSTNAAPATPAKVKTATKPTKYEGSITAIDATSVTIANTSKTITLAISPKTTFKKDKVVATLADFAVGDKVSGSYTKDATGAMTAYSLHKKTPKAPATKPAAPAAAAPAAPATQ
jgi:hypothetical protein